MRLLSFHVLFFWDCGELGVEVQVGLLCLRQQSRLAPMSPLHSQPPLHRHLWLKKFKRSVPSASIVAMNTHLLSLSSTNTDSLSSELQSPRESRPSIRTATIPKLFQYIPHFHTLVRRVHHQCLSTATREPTPTSTTPPVGPALLLFPVQLTGTATSVASARCSSISMPRA